MYHSPSRSIIAVNSLRMRTSCKCFCAPHPKDSCTLIPCLTRWVSWGRSPLDTGGLIRVRPRWQTRHPSLVTHLIKGIVTQYARVSRPDCQSRHGELSTQVGLL